MIQVILCDDCKTDGIRHFMVNDILWLSVAERKEILCLPCFENRLGRKVVLSDLRPCQITYDMMLGAYIALNTPKEDVPPDEFLLDSQKHTIRANPKFDYPRKFEVP